MVAKVLFVLLCGTVTLALIQALEIWCLRKEIQNGRNKERRDS